jgi:HD-GYP domain-containing protein (c-di-GMP phosphodiesterase class II)
MTQRISKKSTKPKKTHGVGPAAPSQFIAVSRKTVPDWLELQRRTHAVLIGEESAGFVAQLNAIHAEVGAQMRDHPDATLTTLIYLGATEIDLYSATHSVLVSALCGLAARQFLRWPISECEAVEKAALSMNIEMTALQDSLARQSQRPSPEQQRLIDLHSVLGAELLDEFGVKDKLWLDAVRHHHDKTPGPLAKRQPSSRLARLIERADVYAARMAPRAGRAPLAPEVAMESCRLAEDGQVDEAGAALIDALGKYPPGSAVRLANGETGIVVSRGTGSDAPKVVVLTAADGTALATPQVRNTGIKQFHLTESVAHRDLGSTADLERILRLA